MKVPNAIKAAMLLASSVSMDTIGFPERGTSPKEYGMALRKNQRKTRKQKRQNPHKY